MTAPPAPTDQVSDYTSRTLCVQGYGADNWPVVDGISAVKAARDRWQPEGASGVTRSPTP